MHLGSRQDLTTLLPKNRVLRHILFWIWLYLLDVIIFGVGYENIQLFFKLALLEMPGQLFFAYVMMYWVMPQFLAKRSTFEIVGLTILSFLICGFLSHILFIIFSSYSKPEPLWDIPKIFLRGFYCVLKACIAIIVKLAVLWLENEKRASAMEKTKLESELKMLKDQVNPHFMFNTLNNLYGLVSKNPLRAQESILRLSAILQFMLHESNDRTIPVKLELKCINDYVELEKLRYTSALSVSINVQEDVKNLAIVPLTLFPFVENSFKHGASELINDAWINIDFSIYKNDFVFKIANSKRVQPSTLNAGGIGLINVKRRLQLVYGNDHTIQIIDDKESFLAIVKIALGRMVIKASEKHENEMSYR